MSIRTVAGVLSSSAALPPAQIVTLVDEQFSTSFGLFQTPGTDDPGRLWFRRSGATPTGSTGPDGGANPTTRAVEASNSYIYTEASSSPVATVSDVFTIEGPELDASAGTLTMTFDLHMRFGTNGDQLDGTLEVQGWNGSAWSTISNAIVGSQQTSATSAYLPSTGFGTYDSTGFTNTDFKFRFRFTEGSTIVTGGLFNYDCAVDNVRITGPASIEPDPTPSGLGFDTGLRRIFVRKSGSDANNGLSQVAPKLTIQSALDSALPGDVITIGDGVYRETLSLSNFGDPSLQLWIVAENRGQARVTNVWEDADEGTVTWNLDSDDVYFASRSSRPYIGSEGNNFLMHYKSEADLRATSITAFSAISGQNETISKPDYGFGFEQGQNRVYLRLKDRSNPNGQSIRLTADFATTLFDLNNADNVIIDGIHFEGAGDLPAVNFDNTCANPTVRNCRFTLGRHGVRIPSNSIVERCEYFYTGFGTWARDLFALDGLGDHGVFVILKGYYNAEDIPEAGGGSGNSLLEGSLDFARDINPVPVNSELRFNLIGPCFDGSRLGESNNSSAHDNVFLECLDDGINFDGLSGHPSDGNEIHDNLFRDCYKDFSFQESTLNGEGFVYRNVIERSNPDLAIRGASLKTISTPAAWDGFVYHNTWRMFYSPALGANLRVWDAFGGATPDRILNFYNNIIMLSDNLSGDHSSNQPDSIETNAVVGTSSGNVTALTQGGGVFAGTTEASMDLDAQLIPNPGSPAEGIGRALVAGNPDSRSGSGVNDDAGAFVVGETVPNPWPRSASTEFDTSIPSRWTSPGS